MNKLRETHCHRSNYEYTPLLARLIETCYQFRIFKLKDLTKLLDISTSYAHCLVKKLHEDLFFKIWAIPYHEKMGLRVLRCFLQVNSALYRQMLLELLSRHEFIICMFQYRRGLDRGVYCEFLVPNGKEGELKSFFEFLQDHGIIDAHVIHPVIALKNLVMGFEWYDFSTNSWRFEWQNLLKDILSNIDSHRCLQSYELEPSTSTTKFDFYDLVIIHHLEQDALAPLKPLALKLKTSPQNLSYHYREHVLGNELIRATRPWWQPFLLEESLFYIVEIEFEGWGALNCFLRSLHRKPIAYSCSYSKQVTHPSVMLSGILPYDEFFNFLNLLDLLKDYGIVKDYDYYIFDLYGAKGRSLPCHCYDEAFGWRFETKSCLEGILKAAENVQKGKAKFVTKLDAKFVSAVESKIESA